MSGLGKDIDERILEELEDIVEETEFSTVNEMLEAREKKTLSVRIPVRIWAEYQVFANDRGYPSKSEAARKAIKDQMNEARKNYKLEQGWRTFLAGLNEPDPQVAAYGLDTLYEADKAHGEIAEKYMEPLMNKLREYEEQEE